ncbi:hypothetical protein SNE510_76150 [Streptomyces sp. NE5-10]|uniref:hypothetical protein n=1 Tax=Streptomyces sp. NE5-10 TaxID=2759674 RepID=UPI00190346BA|nr:hypothetical protein [Streptomyces sp. NE5-10]GHJ98096.1 hypothetical protein SNE510_76150 [Streptomyces sp. NE5-10]
MKQIQDAPPTFELRLPIACTDTYNAGAGYPLVATTRNPMILKTTGMTTDTLNGETFTLEQAAELFQKDEPDTPPSRSASSTQRSLIARDCGAPPSFSPLPSAPHGAPRGRRTARR